jgi:ubiquinone/menaquinone biosynthesis C-methylase UbiE
MTTYFDQRAKNWDTNLVRVERAKVTAQAIRNTIPLQSGMSALELGCGTGLLSFALQPDFASITLADTSQGMLDVLADKIKAAGVDNMHPLQLDLASDPAARGFPLPASRFDVIYSLMTFHHIPDTDTTLRQCHALTAPGGYLCIADLEKEDGSFHKDDSEFDGHNGFDRPQLRKKVEAAGFENVQFTIIFQVPKQIDGVEKTFPMFLMTAKRK